MIRRFVPRPIAAVLLGVAVTACGSATTGAIPDPPATLRQPAEYAWGDVVASADNRLAGHVVALVACGARPSSEIHYVGADDGAVADLQRWYRDRLGSDWRPQQLAFSPGEAGFGFANGGQRFVVAWLPQGTNRQTPVTLFQFRGCDALKR